MIFQNNRNVSQKERRKRKNMTIKLIATSLDNKNWKRDQLLLQTVRSASNICLPSSCWKVSRWKSSRFSGVFHRRRQPVEFLPPRPVDLYFSFEFSPASFRGGGWRERDKRSTSDSSVSELGGAGSELVVYQRRKRGLGRPAGDEV